MTKFEEEFKRPANGPLTELNNNMQEVFSQYRKMRQYADYLEYNSKKKDEEFQELFDKYSNLNDHYEKEVIKSSKLESQIIDLKSQLQQQALPVVPECVAEFIEDCKKEGECLFGIFADATRVEHDMPDLVYFWLGDEGNNDELFARAWLDGYTVEKPQLFYLKNKITGLYLYRLDELSFGEQNYCKDSNDTSLDYCAFTQQEIDSMQTGSYEQIEVEK